MAIQHFALYKAQEGAYVSDLEQLHASTSLPAALLMPFALRKFSKLSLALAGLWCFYYLGSQACKREYELASSALLRNMDGIYPTTRAKTFFDLQGYPTNLEAYALSSYDFYNSFSTEKALPDPPVDMFERVLVPRMDISENATFFRDADGWSRVPEKGHTTIAYAGRPFRVRESQDPKSPQNHWIESKIIGSYKTGTSLFTAQCGEFELLPVDAFPNGTITSAVMSLNLSSDSVPKSNGTLVDFDFWIRWRSWDERQHEMEYDLTSESTVEMHWAAGETGSARVKCSIEEREIEVEVDCTASNFAVRRMRERQGDNGVSTTKSFEDTAWSQRFFDTVLNIGGPPTAATLNVSMHPFLTDSWKKLFCLANSTASLPTEPHQCCCDTGFSPWDPVNADMNLTLNTVYNLAFHGVFDESEEGYDVTTFQGAFYQPQYRISWYWITIDFMSGIILFGSAVFSFWLRKHTIAPDLLGYVSSLTRDNIHLSISEGGSTLSGLDRARYLRDVKVKIVDVSSEDEVRKISLVVMDGKSSQGRLSEHRKYI